MKKGIIKSFFAILSIALITFMVSLGEGKENIPNPDKISPKYKVSLNDNFFVDIAAGTDHSLALDSQGNLWSWGRNDQGQVGNGTTENVIEPVQIMRGHKFKKISAGNTNSVAIDIENNLYYWGNSINIPSALEGKYKDAICTNEGNIKTISLSDEKNESFYSFDNLKIHCDSNELKGKILEENKKIFNSELTDYSLQVYQKFEETSDCSHNWNAANKYRGRHNSYSDENVYSAYIHKELLKNQNRIKCASGVSEVTYSMQIEDRGNWSLYGCLPSITQSLFYIDEQGKINYKNLQTAYDLNGNANCINNYKVPDPIFINFECNLLNERTYKNLSVRKSFSKHSGTAFFVSDAGELFAIGSNGGTLNLLGNSNVIGKESSATPIQIANNLDVQKISCGKNHVMIIDNLGKIYSWGDNTYGQLGTGDNNNYKTPIKILSLDKEKNYSFNALSDEIFKDSFKQNGGSNYTLVEAPSKGTLNINNSTGDFTYKSNSGAYGNDTAVISIDYGPNTVKYQVNIYIDRKPYIAGGETEFNVNYLSSHTGTIPAMDPDGDNLNYSISKYPSKGTLEIDSQSGRYTYTSKNDCAGSDEFTVSINDGYYTLYTSIKVHIETTITIHDTTDIVIDNTNSTSYSGNLNAKDLDGDKITYSITGQPSKGFLTLDETGGYEYTPKDGEYGQDTFTLQATDGKTPISTTYNIELYQIKDNGTQLNNKITIGEVLQNNVKVDAKNCTPNFSLKTDGEKGNVTINKDTGEYIYTPKPNTRGADSFVANVNYGYGNYDVTINVYQNTNVDDSLVIKDIITKENTNYKGNVTCTDIDSDTLRYKVNVNPHLGRIDLNELTGEYTYYPSRNVSGWDSTVIIVNDGINTKSISLTIKIESEISVENTIEKTINQNNSLSENVNATDKDGDKLTYKLKVSPESGSASVDSSTGDYTYVPNTGFYGNDTFVIEVNDGTTPKEITVNVKVNRKPITDNIEYNLIANGNSVSGSAKCSDPDGDKLTYRLEKEPTKGQVILDENTGNFAYVPNSNAAGNDTFIVTATDGNDKVMVTVNIHNETELTLDDQETNIVVNQGKSTTGQVLATDEDGDSLSYKLKEIPTQGMVKVNEHTGAWTFEATAKAAGVDKFSIDVTDGNTTKTITYNLTINTPSSFEDNTIDSFETNINTTYNGLVKATDKDGDPLTYSVISQGLKGNVTIDPTTGRYIYVPNYGEAGSDSFVLGVNDGNFTTELVVKVHIETKVQVEEGTQSVIVDKNGVITGKSNAFDADGDVLTYKISQQGEKGNANVTKDGSWSYFANNGAGDDSFIIEVRDGNHQAYVTVYIHINSEPSFESGNISITVGHGQSTKGQAIASDEDGDSLSFNVSSQPTHGIVNLNSKTGEFEYTAFSNSVESSDSFVVSVTDGVTVKNVTVNVLINNAPSSKGTSIKLESGKSISGLLSATDPDGDILSYSITQQGDKGTAVINEATGEFTYTAKPDTEGYDCFIVSVNDGYQIKSYLVEVNIDFVDSNNSWAIPTVATTGSVALLSLGFALFIFLYRRKAK